MISQPITADSVTAIVAIDDPVLRNLWITQAYADFSARLHASLDELDHTWCGFAVWASDTAGQSIRRQEVPGLISDILGASDHHQQCIDAANRTLRHLRMLHLLPLLEHDHVLRSFDGAIDAVSEHVAHGNRLVFAELAPLFVAFLELVETGEGTSITVEDVDVALASAASGPVEPDVQQAFHWYQRAIGKDDGPRRAFAVLAGNVLAVAHEQRRLQADIVDAIDAGLLTAEHVVGEMLPRRTPRGVVGMVGRLVHRPVERLLRSVWQDAMTELLMTLRVPGAALRLRQDLPVDADGQRFPPDLADLTGGPADLNEAVAVFEQWDRTGGTGHGEGARDWAVLGERMNYIVNLFRSRQQDRSLAVGPFTDAQLDAMGQGKVPPGPLLPPSHPPTAGPSQLLNPPS